MNVFITGVAGFIASNLADKLIKDHRVIGIDNFDDFYDKRYKLFNISDLKANPSFKLYEGDIRDAALLNTIFDENKIDIVIHLAAKAGVRPSIENVELYYDVNVNGTVNILQIMKSHQVSKLVFASSSSVYGNNDKLPFSEADSVDTPISPYASTKKAGELLCHVYSHLYKFDINCLRFFTVYGPRQRPDLAIHKFTRMIMEEKAIPFFGDGTTARDYTYIDDIVQGIEGAMHNLNGYHVYNLGESQTVTLNDLIYKLGNLVGKEVKLNKLPMQAGDVEKTYADISKAKTFLDYNPTTKIDEGLAKFVNWYTQNLSVV